MDATLVAYRQRLNDLLTELFSQEPSNTLMQAMAYSAMGGKRLRALLVYAAGEVTQAPMTMLDRTAMAIELIHAYSLIHDDLPAMDNAELRHGKLTCHKKFGEAMAILAGDALQSLAFELLAQNEQVRTLQILARAIGWHGMAYGQYLDLAAQGHQLSLEQLKNVHVHKTGALIVASVQLGALVGSPDAATLRALTKFAERIGLAYQIQDDILDVEGATEILGKDQGLDAARHKATYPAFLGVTEARLQLAECYQQALQALKNLPHTQSLEHIAAFIVQREY